jgi:lysozyme family protein
MVIAGITGGGTMTASFEAAFSFTVMNPQIEGGLQLSHIKGDKGGQTFAGIARVYWPQWVGWEMLDAGVPPDSPQIMDALKGFYLVNFWKPINGENLPIRLALQVFDMAVNSGCDDAAECLQRALGTVKVDGQIGMKTIIAARNSDPAKIAVRFVAERARHYAKCKPIFPGWFNRLALLLEQAAA